MQKKETPSAHLAITTFVEVGEQMFRCSGFRLTCSGSVSCTSTFGGVPAVVHACASKIAILVLSVQNDFCIFVVFLQRVIFRFDCTLILLSVGSISACLYVNSSHEHTDKRDDGPWCRVQRTPWQSGRSLFHRGQSTPSSGRPQFSSVCHCFIVVRVHLPSFGHWNLMGFGHVCAKEGQATVDRTLKAQEQGISDDLRVGRIGSLPHRGSYGLSWLPPWQSSGSASSQDETVLQSSFHRCAARIKSLGSSRARPHSCGHDFIFLHHSYSVAGLLELLRFFGVASSITVFLSLDSRNQRASKSMMTSDDNIGSLTATRRYIWS